MQQQLTFDFLTTDSFLDYHRNNPQIYQEFKAMTLRLIARGVKHYSSKAIFEVIRYHTAIKGNDKFKINNTYTAYYSRLFEKEYPEFKGFFETRTSKFDNV